MTKDGSAAARGAPRLAPEELPEIWRGSVAAWECDDMGHMNVRFYVSKFTEGLQSLARLMGMTKAFSPSAASTLIVKSHHIRFLREGRPGAPLVMTGGVLRLDEAEADVVQILRHQGSGEPAATVLTRIAHAEPRLLQPFPWPERARRAAAALLCDAPDFARPRGLEPEPPSGRASLKAADELGMACIGRGVVQPQDLDGFGRLRPEGFIGRIADGVPTLLADFRQVVLQHAGPEVRRVGGAVLENHLVYVNWPRAGDHLEIRSGVKAAGDKSLVMIHWLLDPETGAAWGGSKALAVNLDLDARKIVPTPEVARAAFADRMIPSLTL